MLHYITYKCKDCGTEKRIIEQWGDLKPKRCTGRKCRANFEAEPDKLETTLPKKPAQAKSKPATKKKTTKKKKAESSEDELPLQEHQVHDS
jgi:hypothetical protein